MRFYTAMTSIKTRLGKTHASISKALKDSDRKDQVLLLAVSKTKPADAVREAWHCGQKAFGENYVQEGVDKIHALNDLVGIEWHFIGPLQSNKSRPVAESFHWVHSVDRLKIARRLSEQRPEHLPPLNICLQVNIDNEASKSGLKPEEVMDVAAQVIELPNITLRGLMAIPAPSATKEQQSIPLRALKTLLTDLQTRYPDSQLDTLSMGMSDDMSTAIAEGSTIVRVGTAIFGSRDYFRSKQP